MGSSYQSPSGHLTITELSYPSHPPHYGSACKTGGSRPRLAKTGTNNMNRKTPFNRSPHSLFDHNGRIMSNTSSAWFEGDVRGPTVAVVQTRDDLTSCKVTETRKPDDEVAFREPSSSDLEKARDGDFQDVSGPPGVIKRREFGHRDYAQARSSEGGARSLKSR